MSSPNCGDKVEVQLLFMAFFIYICYMAERLRKIEANLDAYNLRSTTFLKNILKKHPDKEMEDLCYFSLSAPDSVITFDTEFSDNVIERIKSKLEIVKNQLSCLKKENYDADVIKKVQKHLDKMSYEIINFVRSLPQVNGGRRRKSRKKRGKGMGISKMRRKKHMSSRQPKEKYVIEAIQILKQDQSYLIADIVKRGQKIRNLALQLEDNAKKGGKRKRKSRRKSRRRTKKRKRSRRRKTNRRRR